MAQESQQSAINVMDDPVEDFLKHFEQQHEQEGGTENEPEGAVEKADEQSGTDNVEGQTQQGTDSQVPEETKKEEGQVVSEETATEETKIEITPEKEIEIFNKLTGLGVDSVDKIKEYSETLNKLPEYQKKLELYPTLLEKLKASQDVMSHFPDEQTYKVAQLIKNEKYKGKDAELTKVLKSDLSQLPELEIIKLHAGINAPAGVKNPLRFAIRKMGLDPDEVISNFEELSDDDKDLFYGFASQAKEELQGIGKDIEIPKSLNEDIEALLQSEISSAKDDLANRQKEVMPIASSIVNEIKEFKVDDNFSFKLDLTAEDKQEYSEFLAQAVLSGDFDVKTDEGKRDLYNALMDEIWIDNRDKILKAYETELKTKIEREFREKYDNTAPLTKETPKPGSEQTPRSTMVDVIEKMIGELT